MIGTIVAHYEILKKLGSGGMGIVYKAKDTRLNRFVALKFLPQELDVSKTDRDRFIREAQSASALDHQNICTVYEIGETDEGQMFIAMAYYEGDTLKKIMASGPLAIQQTLDFAGQIAQGLNQAHAHGIIHRDVKPANVIVTTDGIAKLLDFGLAKSPDAALTRPGTILGTVSYMSPEQTQSQVIDHRTDIWSLGVVMYEMLTGISPFKKNNEAATIYAIVYKEPEEITAIRSDLPGEFAAIVEKCLAKNPDNRFQDITALIAAVHSLTHLPEAKANGAPLISEAPGESTTLSMPRPIRELEAEKHGLPLTQPTPKPARRKPQESPPSPKRKTRAAIPLLALAVAAVAALLVFNTDLRKTVERLFEKEHSAVFSIVSQPPGAAVFFNGDSVGVTPFRDFRSQSGKTNLVLRKAGFMQKDSSLQTRPGQIAHLSFSLMPQPPAVDAGKFTKKDATPQIPVTNLKEKSPYRARTSQTDKSLIPTGPPAKLTLQAIPLGSVQILKTSEMKPAGAPLPFTLAAGIYDVRFRHPQHGTRDTTIVLKAGEHKNLICYFEGYLNVSSLNENEQPVWANVYVDGRNTDRPTPLADYVLPPGRHIVTVMKSGYTTLSGEKKMTILPRFSKPTIRLKFYIRKNQ